MSSIHEALNSDGALTLGPVTIKKNFGSKVTAKGKKMQTVVISDASGESKLTLFEPAAFANLPEGSTVSFKGKIDTNEYNGTKSLQSGFAKVTGAPEESETISSEPAAQVQTSSPNQRDMQIIRQNALSHATALVVASGINSIFDAQADVFALADKFAHYSATGEVLGEE